VEVILKKQMYNECDESKKYIRQIFEAEKAICTISKCIYVCSEEDKINLVKTYKIDSKKIFVIPNGVDVSKSRFVAPNNRKVAKKVYGLENERIGVFIGSSHKPNIEAVNQILGLASQCTDTKFIILGSVCKEFKLDGLPQNVGMLGVVDEKVKNKVFSLVDFALNPMMSGTGTNVKVFDYMASGIPVITTEIGARGIECRESLIISTIDEFKDIINSFDYENYETRISAARKYVLDNFDWELLGNKLLDLFHN